MMRNHISSLADSDGSIYDKKRNSHIFHPTQEVRQDMLMAAAIIADSYHNPLSIIDNDPPVPLFSVPVYPDASGHIAGTTSPCLGVFFPPHDLQHAAAFGFPFPTDFLLY